MKIKYIIKNKCLYFLLLLINFLYSINIFCNMIFISNGKYYSIFKFYDKNNNYIYFNSFLLDKYFFLNFDFFKYIYINKKYLNKIIFNFNLFFNNCFTYISWFFSNMICNFYSKILPGFKYVEYILNSSKFFSFIYYENKYINKLLFYYLNYFNKYLSFKILDCNFWYINGLYGIIWEWVLDFNNIIFSNVDTEGDFLQEILFCGSISTISIDVKNYISFIRYAFRNNLFFNYLSFNLGFRCVKYNI